MRCERIQELLKADYLDNEINPKDAQALKEHLAACAHCRTVDEQLRLQRTLFQEAGVQKAPERVWEAIRDKIIAEQLAEEQRLSAGIFERLRNYVGAPRPAVVWAGALTVVFFAVFFAGMLMQRGQMVSKQDSLNGDLAAYSLNGAGDTAVVDFGTEIEEYFL